MFTELKIKRICNSFKAPDIEIPLLSAKVAKRPRLVPVLATAALALVIVGASVVGIKGNIFKGEQPLPPVDTDTPDTPDTPTPPDTDTPTPPEDDVKIIYADSAPGIGLGIEWVGPLAGELWIADDFEKVLNSNESKDCKFAVYIAINSGLGYNTRDLLSEYDEKYRQLLEVCDEAQITRIMLTHVIDDGYDDNVKYFKEYREKFIITFEEYMKDVTEGSNDVILFTEEEIEKLNKIISLTDDELKENMTLLRELEKTFMIICSDAYIKLDEYEKEIRSSVIADYANSVTVKEFEKIGLKNVRCISEKKAKTLGIEVFNGDIFEATLTRDEIYSLKETKYGIYLYPREYGIDLSANE